MASPVDLHWQPDCSELRMVELGFHKYRNVHLDAFCSLRWPSPSCVSYACRLNNCEVFYTWPSRTLGRATPTSACDGWPRCGCQQTKPKLACWLTGWLVGWLAWLYFLRLAFLLCLLWWVNISFKIFVWSLFTVILRAPPAVCWIISPLGSRHTAHGCYSRLAHSERGNMIKPYDQAI